MKKYILICVASVLFLSCKKEATEINQEVKPVLIKVEAVHTTGQIVTSHIVYVR